jgi:hypothetical protein
VPLTVACVALKTRAPTRTTRTTSRIVGRMNTLDDECSVATALAVERSPGSPDT